MGVSPIWSFPFLSFRVIFQGNIPKKHPQKKITPAEFFPTWLLPSSKKDPKPRCYVPSPTRTSPVVDWVWHVFFRIFSDFLYPGFLFSSKKAEKGKIFRGGWPGTLASIRRVFFFGFWDLYGCEATVFACFCSLGLPQNKKASNCPVDCALLVGKQLKG